MLQLSVFLLIEMKGKDGCWKDIIALYKEDKKNSLRLTKITHTSIFPKLLQRQSVPLVCQVFQEKTVTALIALKNTVNPHEAL